ncbi:MAG: hypothetical protein ACM3PP_04920 [Candidatus Saccharibacteria bacterium]
MSVSAWLIMMALILVATAVYSAKSRDRIVREISEEMKTLMDDAKIIRQDLEACIQNAVMVSDGMIEKIDMRLQRMETLQTTGEIALPAAVETTKRKRGRPPKIQSDHVIEKKAVEKPVKKKVEKQEPGEVPFYLEDIRRAHPYIIVPRLYNEGYTVPQIAELLDKGQGEIKLILDVQKRREVGS